MAGLLAEEDVMNLAAAMEPGTTARVLVWENTWAALFASAARRSGGQLIADGRIPIQAILASIEADEPAADEEAEKKPRKEPDMPIGRMRRGVRVILPCLH